MKAAVLEERGVMTYREVPTADAGPGKVRLRVEASSLCGSDIKRYVAGHRTYPMVLGHECAGVIDLAGDGVDPALIGRRAALIPLVPCFDCGQCEQTLYSACDTYSFIGSREDGGFADYVELPVGNALLLPDDLAFEQGALIEPATVARHMLALADFQAGSTAIVFGAGSIGLMLVQWLRILGAELIVSVDIAEDNLTTARTLGAHVTLNATTSDVVDEVRTLTGNGVDVALEAAGTTQTLQQCVPVTRPRGTVICGGNQPDDQTLPTSLIENLMRRELRLIGCFMSYSGPFPGHEWIDSLAAVRSGALDLEAMITHRLSLSAAPSVFADIEARTLRHRKIILRPDHPEEGAA